MTHKNVIDALDSMLIEADTSQSFTHQLWIRTKSITKEEAERIANMTFKDFWEDFIRDQ